MNNSPSTPSLRQIIADVKQYLSLQYEWIKLDSVDKLTRIISALVILMFSVILVSIALLYLSLAAVHYIETYTGIIGAYAIIAGIFLVLLALVWLLRRVCIVNPILRFLYKLFIPSKDSDELPRKNNEL